MRLLRLFRCFLDERGGLHKLGALYWVSDTEGPRFACLDVETSEEADGGPECVELALPAGREMWTFGGAADVALRGRAA